MSNYYTKSEVDSKIDESPNAYKVGDRIGDWVVYESTSSYMRLFPLRDQISGTWKEVNSYCGNYRTSTGTSGRWTTLSSNMPSIGDFYNIQSVTGMTGEALANHSIFWLSDYEKVAEEIDYKCVVASGSIHGDSGNGTLGARPLITLVK